MRFKDTLLNNVYEFPDGTPPEVVRQAVAPIHEQHFNNLRRQQTMAGLSGLGQALQNSLQTEQRSPSINPVAAMAMGPNYQSAREAQIQDMRSQQEKRMFEQQQAYRQQAMTAQQRLQQQQMLQQQMEREKDRKLQLDYHQAMMDNREREYKLQERQITFNEEQARKRAQKEAEEAAKPIISSGQYITIDENNIPHAAPIPGYTGRGSGNGGGRGSNDKLVWNAQEGRFGTVDETGTWTPLKKAGESTLPSELQDSLDVIDFQIKELGKNDNLTPEEKSIEFTRLKQAKNAIERTNTNPVEWKDNTKNYEIARRKEAEQQALYMPQYEAAPGVPPAQQAATTQQKDEYQVGTEYTLNGTKAIYLGNGMWEPQ